MVVMGSSMPGADSPARSIAALAGAILCACMGAVAAAECEVPACPSGDTYRDGYCDSSSGPPTFARSHTRAVCAAGWTLDAAKGTCTRGECCEKALCVPGERYGRSETYRGRPYGVCESGPGLGGVRSHTMRECEAGWDLDGSTGVCRKRGCGIAISPAGPIVAPRPAEVVRKADLTIRDWWVRPDAKSGNASNEVKFGQKYQVCFIVANIGLAPSGSFTVQGGGLGVASGPVQHQAGMARGESREGCLDYPATPPPGAYRLIVTVDGPNAVDESNETNNSRSEEITVFP